MISRSIPTAALAATCRAEFVERWPHTALRVGSDRKYQRHGHLDEHSQAESIEFSHPLHRHPIQLERTVRSQDREALVQRLNNEHPVEGIVVVQREIAQEVTMSQADRQRDELIPRDDVLYEPLHP